MASAPPISVRSSCKGLRVEPIRSDVARRLCARLHYSGKSVQNSNIHFGVIWAGKLEGVMQFGPPLVKRQAQNLVKGTTWDGFCELNRLAFSERLPRNSESRALGVALRILSKTYPSLEWILSYSDATQCGDGTIYRASGFVLTGIKKSKSLYRLQDGRVVQRMSLEISRPSRIQDELRNNHDLPTASVSCLVKAAGLAPLDGYQLRYIKFLRPGVRERLMVPELPFSKIAELGASMYLGKRTKHSGDAASTQEEEGGSTPTRALQKAPR